MTVMIYRLLVTVFLIGFSSLLSAQEHAKIVIKGTARGNLVKAVKLVIFNAQKETIPVRIASDGSFGVTTKQAGVYPAEFQSADGSFYIPFFIESGCDYQVELDLDNLGQSVIKGGEAQALFLAIENLRAEKRKAVKELEDRLMPRFMEAYNKGDKATAADSACMKSVMEQFEEQEKTYKSKERQLFGENSDNLVVAFRLYGDMPELEMEEIRERFDMLSQRSRDSFIGRKISEAMEKMQVLEVGKIAPDFTMKNPEGKEYSLHSIRGKVKIVDFWASWCAPCRAENPRMKKLYADFKEKGLEIIGVSLDKTRMSWIKAVNDDGLTWVQLSDLMGNASPVMKRYNVEHIPFTIVLDEENRIIARNLRGEELYQKIAELLTAPSGETNGEKELFARRSFLNKPMPALHIDKWISEPPRTEGKFVLYEFWATYCGPCLKAFPHLNSMAKEFKDDLVIIGIAPQSEKTVRAMKKPVMEFYSAIDENNKNQATFELEGIPHSKLVSPEGIVIWEGCPVLEGFELTTEKVRALIQKYKK